jgi:hypothetical protein
MNRSASTCPNLFYKDFITFKVITGYVQFIADVFVRAADFRQIPHHDMSALVFFIVFWFDMRKVFRFSFMDNTV